ncbi:hypothetical protein K438DRAFT_1976483 [Mycena galopus ATCC 62051]|nr:hypothetical protein K438DRAFT_1976483 [Mycena galopus ATCC 62051]
MSGHPNNSKNGANVGEEAVWWEIPLTEFVNPDVVYTTSRFIKSVDRVDSVSTPYVDWPAFRHIAMCGTHVTLHRFPLGRPPSPEDLFGRLQSISLTDIPLSDAVDPGRTSIPGLAEETLFATLAQRCSQPTLIHLSLTAILRGVESVPPGPPITTPILQFDLDDSAVAAAAVAWPALESLTLNATGCANSTPFIALCLYPLAQHRPRLQFVAISVRTPFAPNIQVLPPSSHRLTVLSIAHSPLASHNARVTALILRAIFPNLHRIEYPSHPPIFSKPWADVLSLLRRVPDWSRRYPVFSPYYPILCHLNVPVP